MLITNHWFYVRNSRPVWVWCSASQNVIPGPATLASSRNMLETQIFRPHCRFTKFETMGMEPSNLCFNNSPYICCRKGDPFQGLKLGSCLTLRNELSEETHVLTKQEILLESAPGRRAGGWGDPGELLCSLAADSGFMGMGLVSGWSLANHSNSESFLVAHAWLSQDGC